MQKGFTLLELLVVIAIIGILSSIVLVSYNGYTNKARIAKTLQWASSINHSLGDRAVGAWTFDNITGVTVYDDSGNNNNGTAYGGPAVENGVVGKGLSFDGVNDYVQLSTSFNSNNKTVSLWFKATSLIAGANKEIIISNGWDNGPADFRGWHIEATYYGDAKLRVLIADSVNARKTMQSSVLTDDVWYHITMVHDYDNSVAKLYMDGKYVTQVVVSGYTPYTANNARIGVYSWILTSGWFNGLIDDVRIYSAALTQAQIQQHYADGLRTHQNLAVCDSVSF